MARPEPAAHLLGVAAQSLDDPGARWRRHRTAVESRVGEVKGAPEELHRRMAASISRTMVIEHQVDLGKHSPETIGHLWLVACVSGVVGKWNRIADLGGARPEACFDAERIEGRHEVRVEVGDGPRRQWQAASLAPYGLDHHLVVDEVHVDLEDQARAGL